LREATTRDPDGGRRGRVEPLASPTRARGGTIMNQLRLTAHYEAPIEHVFDLGTQFKRFPEWNVSYTAVDEVTGPPDKVGTKVHATMRLLGRPMDGWAEIVEVERPRLIKLIGTSSQGGKLTTTYRFMPVEQTTDVELLVEYELPAGVIGQIADKLFVEKAVERDIRHSLENFKAFVEQPVPVLT
jgi:uncharacterized membrane protein